MIKFKTDRLDDTHLHNKILYDINKITPKNPLVFIHSVGGNLLNLEIQDHKLDESEKMKLKDYIHILESPTT